MSVLDNQKSIEAEFATFADWEVRYKKIIEMGKNLPDLPAELKTEQALVKGCQSQVWMHAHLEDGKMIIKADSDALIVKGLVAVLVKVYSGQDPAEIMVHEPDFVERLGFKSHLSPSRANGFFAMIKQIKYFALALNAIKRASK
jgi:cysteine desulfuration protein SufE